MGLFDTIHFPEPLHVPGFSRPVTETQTKLFANAMRNYSVGSILPEAPVLIGVVEDFIWCAPEPGEHEGKQHPIYFAIWHRVLAGIYLDAQAAQQRLHSVDRLDLVEWLDSAQNDAQKWKQRYWRLLSDIKALHRHQSEPEPSEESENAIRRFMMRLPDEILRADDPLAALLEMHQKEDPPEADGLFW